MKKVNWCNVLLAFNSFARIGEITVNKTDDKVLFFRTFRCCYLIIFPIRLQ